MHNSYYRADKIFLSVLGLWPYQTNLTKLSIRILFFLIVIGIVIPMIIGLYEVWGDMNLMMECLSPLNIAFLGMILFINFMFNNKELKVLFDSIETDWITWSSLPEIEILKKYAKEGKIFRLTYFCSIFGLGVFFLSLPLVAPLLDLINPQDEPRPMRPLYIAEFYIDPEAYYKWIFIYNCIASVLVISFFVCGDMIFIGTTQHACCIFEAIGSRLKNIVMNINYSVDNGTKMQYEIDEEILICIKEHDKIMNFVKNIHNFCSIVYCIIIVLSMLLISITGVEVVLNLKRLDLCFRYAFSVLAQIFRLLYISIPCQKLINNSLGISDFVYSGNWYELPLKSQKILLMTMKRSSRPNAIIAGKMYTYSMENFAMVLKTSMSYLTVLTSLQ